MFLFAVQAVKALEQLFLGCIRVRGCYGSSRDLGGDSCGAERCCNSRVATDFLAAASLVAGLCMLRKETKEEKSQP